MKVSSVPQTAAYAQSPAQPNVNGSSGNSAVDKIAQLSKQEMEKKIKTDYAQGMQKEVILAKKQTGGNLEKLNQENIKLTNATTEKQMTQKLNMAASGSTFDRMG